MYTSAKVAVDTCGVDSRIARGRFSNRCLENPTTHPGLTKKNLHFFLWFSDIERLFRRPSSIKYVITHREINMHA
jgi:hypothetical protein